MKNLKRIISITLLMITILGCIAFPNVSNAANKTATLYGTHRFSNLLERNGMNVNCIYTVYNEDGIEYPAYCLNLELDGATENFAYTVTANEQLTNMEIWRTVINGYPYKTPEELGCSTKEEAFLATKQAIYCAVYNRDPESYGSLGGEAGERTLNAMKNIVYTARNSSEVKQSSTLTINTASTKWEIDNLDKNYVSKEFTVTAAAGIKEYSINASGDLVEGMKVTDINNIEKQEFISGQHFKILIPLKNIEKDGNFSINADGKVATYPVLYGKAPSSNLQNVAITGSKYEDGLGTKTEYYFKNETKIVIQKQDQETKQALQGVKFEILDENKEPLYADLTTNEEGKIVVENLMPGKYYIKETETNEGYEVYEKQIEVELKLNEEITVTVNNLANNKAPQIEKTKTELEVEQIESKKEVKQEAKAEPETKPEQINYSKITLPKTGM